MIRLLQQYGREHLPQEHGTTPEFVLKSLLRQVGGAILVIADEICTQNLPTAPVDDGILEHCCEGLDVRSDAFAEVLTTFREPSSTDRFQEASVARLATHFNPNQKSELAKLVGQPQDGAFFISFASKVFGAAEMIRHFCSYKLKSNGACGMLAFGTRHEAGLAVAEFLSVRQQPGVIFVASDSGGMTLMLPSAGGPKAWHCPADCPSRLDFSSPMNTQDPFCECGDQPDFYQPTITTSEAGPTGESHGGQGTVGPRTDGHQMDGLEVLDKFADPNELPMQPQIQVQHTVSMEAGCLKVGERAKLRRKWKG